MSEFTPTQEKMLEILSDGKPHSRKELHSCCGPSLLRVVGSHLRQIRLKIRPKGEDVVCVIVQRKFMYQHVRLLNGSHE